MLHSSTGDIAQHHWVSLGGNAGRDSGDFQLPHSKPFLRQSRVGEVCSLLVAFICAAIIVISNIMYCSSVSDDCVSVCIFLYLCGACLCAYVCMHMCCVCCVVQSLHELDECTTV